MFGVTVCDIALSVNCWYYIGACGVRFVQLAVAIQLNICCVYDGPTYLFLGLQV